MNSDLEQSSFPQLRCQTGVSMNRYQDGQQPPDKMDNFKRDRFELISAYLDGEVTADERRQVEEWLKTDTSAQCLYNRLLKLRQTFRVMPMPSAEQATDLAESTVQQVMRRVERRPRVVAAWGGAAIAAGFLGFLVHLPDIGSVAMQQVASRSVEKESISKSVPTLVEPDALMIALDRPIIEIPKAPTSAMTAVDR